MNILVAVVIHSCFCSTISVVTSVCVQTGILQDVTQNNMQIGWQILRLNTKATKTNISLMKQSIYNNNMKLQCHKATALWSVSTWYVLHAIKATTVGLQCSTDTCSCREYKTLHRTTINSQCRCAITQRVWPYVQIFICCWWSEKMMIQEISNS